MKSSTLKIVVVFIIACLIWGSTWFAIRISLNSLTPLISAGFRFLLASVFIIIFMKIKRIKIQTDKTSLLLYLLMGIFSFVIPFGLVYWGEQYVPSGLASVLFAVYPFFIAIFSFYFISRDTVGINKIIGIILGFLGIVIIFSENLFGELHIFLPGMIAIVLSAMLQGGIQVTIKKYGGYLNPLSMNFIPMLFAGIVMILPGIFFEDISSLKFDTSAYLSVTYLALFGSLVTFTSYYWLLQRVNVVILSFITFISPIIALFLGWILLNEVLSTIHLIGSLVVLAGIFTAIAGNFNSLRKKIFLSK